MATIRASCPSCGDVELSSREINILMCISTGEGSYAFRCPACLLAVSKPAEERIIELLVSAGVDLKTWSLPEELSETHVGNAISHDDLLDFHYELQQDGWYERITNGMEKNER